MRVTINITISRTIEIIVNLKAPNNKVLNLFNRHGGNGDNLLNTVISSSGTTSFGVSHPSFPSGFDPLAPFTGTFMATAANNVGPTNYVSNATSFEELYSVPNGDWMLAMVDVDDGAIGSLTGWAIEFDYSTY